MAENDLDSGQAPETAGSPPQQSSGGTGDQRSSLDVAKLQSSLEAIAKRLDEVDARSKSLQGDKDRGVNQTKKEVDELKRQIAEIEKLKGTGLSADSAIEEFTFREDVRSLREQLSKINPVSTQTAGNGAGGAADATKAVITDLSLDANSPDVVSILARGLDPDKQELELRRLASRPRPQPSAAESATITSESVAPSKDTAALVSKVAELQKQPTKNKAELAKLYSELDKRGWK